MALTKFKCINPTCLSMSGLMRECPHQQQARMDDEAKRARAGQDTSASDALLIEGLEMLEALEHKQRVKKQAAAAHRTAAAAAHQPSAISLALLPPLSATLASLLNFQPPQHIWSAKEQMDFDELATPEAKKERKVTLWHERSAKAFSMCALPFLPPPIYIPPAMRTAYPSKELLDQQAARRLAQSRDVTLLANVFSFLSLSELVLTCAHISHLARVATHHSHAWSRRAFTVGDPRAPSELPLLNSMHERGQGGTAAPPPARSVWAVARRLPRSVRDKIEVIQATHASASSLSALAEFKLDVLLLFPNATALDLDVGPLNGGNSLRQKALSTNRIIEDVIVTKQLKSMRHFALSSDPQLATAQTSCPATCVHLMRMPPAVLASESRAAQFLRQVIPGWELSGPPSSAIRAPLSPSISSGPATTGLLTLDLERVLFQGCWVLRMLERACCSNLRTLTLSVSFAASIVDKAGIAPTADGPGTHDNSVQTLNQARLSDLFSEMKTIPALFSTFQYSLKHLSLRLSNDPVLAREKVTESTACLIFLPVLKCLEVLSITNLKLAYEGGAIVPLTASNNFSTIGRAPPVYSALFHVPSYRHLLRAQRTDVARRARTEFGWGSTEGASDDGAEQRSEDDADYSEDEDAQAPGPRPERKVELLGDLASRIAIAEFKSKTGMTDAETAVKETFLTEEKTADGPLPVPVPPPSPPPDARIKFSTLCKGDPALCKCHKCASSLHDRQTTFDFIMSYVSKLSCLHSLTMDDLSISDNAIITTTTTTRTRMVKRAVHGARHKKHAHAMQEISVVTTESSVAFSSPAPFLALARLCVLSLPISCFEFDPSVNLVDSVCALLGPQLRELRLTVYGNAWVSQGDVIQSVDGADFEPMPLVIKDEMHAAGHTTLPFPRLNNLNKLAGLIKLAVRRDTKGLAASDPVLPLLPLLHSLSLRTSPSLCELEIDGFALGQEAVWKFFAANLGTLYDHAALARANHTGSKHAAATPAGDTTAKATPTVTRPQSPQPAVQTTHSVTAPHATTGGAATAGGRASLSDLLAPLVVPSAVSAPVSPSRSPLSESKHPALIDAPRFIGLRALTIHNYYGAIAAHICRASLFVVRVVADVSFVALCCCVVLGTLTQSHLTYLRGLGCLRRLSLGNFSLNHAYGSKADLSYGNLGPGGEPIPVLPSAHLSPVSPTKFSTSDPRAYAAIEAAAAEAALAAANATPSLQPLSSSMLSSLSDLLPELRSLELIGQEQITNGVLKRWAACPKEKKKKRTGAHAHGEADLDDTEADDDDSNTEDEAARSGDEQQQEEEDTQGDHSDGPGHESITAPPSSVAGHSTADADVPSASAAVPLSSDSSLSSALPSCVSSCPPSRTVSARSSSSSSSSLLTVPHGAFAHTINRTATAPHTTTHTRLAKHAHLPSAVAAGAGSARPSSPSPPVPFPHLCTLKLSNCRPLGYSGLAALIGGPKLQALEWRGVEQERKLMHAVQISAVKADKDAAFYYSAK